MGESRGPQGVTTLPACIGPGSPSPSARAAAIAARESLGGRATPSPRRALGQSDSPCGRAPSPHRRIVVSSELGSELIPLAPDSPRQKPASPQQAQLNAASSIGGIAVNAARGASPTATLCRMATGGSTSSLANATLSQDPPFQPPDRALVSPELTIAEKIASPANGRNWGSSPGAPPPTAESLRSISSKEQGSLEAIRQEYAEACRTIDARINARLAALRAELDSSRSYDMPPSYPPSEAPATPRLAQGESPGSPSNAGTVETEVDKDWDDLPT